MQYRQGDVLIEKISTVPSDTEKVECDQRGVVLAEGEATGHAHTIDRSAVGSVVADADGDLYFDVQSDVTIDHQEHDSIPLPPGQYRSQRQREYSPQQIVRVAD